MKRLVAAFGLWLCFAVPAFAQKADNLPVVGILRINMADTVEPFATGFKTALAALGLVDGHNIRFEVRLAEGDAARIAGGPKATMTLAFAWTSDWASSGNRAASPSASRTSKWPSTNPSAASAVLNPVANGSTVSAVLMRRMPTTGSLSAFCADAGTAIYNHRANAATRRFIRGPSRTPTQDRQARN